MTIPKRLSTLAAGFALLALGACASVDPNGPPEAQDPYESTNRVIHDVNVGLDRYVLRPVSKGYGFAVPQTIRHLIGNGVNHLELPIDMVNYALQGDFSASGRALGRLTINTFLGAGGLLDPATEMGIGRDQTDFGVTLGKWGVGQGPYLVLPFLGPSTPRDFGGYVVDRAFYPPTYFTFTDVGVINEAPPVIFGTSTIDRRHRNADLIDSILYESPDSYVTLRSIYLQRRQALISGGTNEDALPDIFDDEPAAEPAQ